MKIKLNKGSVTVTSTKADQKRLKRYAQEHFDTLKAFADYTGYSRQHIYMMSNGLRNIPREIMDLIYESDV